MVAFGERIAVRRGREPRPSSIDLAIDLRNHYIATSLTHV